MAYGTTATTLWYEGYHGVVFLLPNGGIGKISRRYRTKETGWKSFGSRGTYMSIRGFGSDNFSGVLPEVFNALKEAAYGHQHSYGEDLYMERYWIKRMVSVIG